MYDYGDPYDKEEERDRVLRQLLGEQDAPPARQVDLPEVTITADRAEVPQRVSMSADDFPTDQMDTRAPELMHAREKPIAPIDGADEGSGGGASDWGTLAALVLDVAANKGRGVGQLVGAYAHNREASDREKRAHADKMAELQMRKGATARDQDMADWVAVDRSQRDWASQAEREKEIQRANDALQFNKDKFGQQLSTDTPLNQTKAAMSGLTAESRTNAVTDSLRDNPRAVTAEQSISNQRADEALAEAKRGRAAAEGQRADNERQRQTNDFNTKYGGAIETLNAAQTLQKLIGDKGDIAGVGPIVGSRFMPDALKSDEAIREQQAFAAFQNPGFVARSGKAVTPTEAPRLEQEFGNLKSTNPEVVRNAVKAIAETMRGTILRGSVGREDIAREVLSSQHLDDVLGPAVPDDAPPSARDAMPQAGPRPVTGTPDNLGVMGGRTRETVPALGGLSENEARAQKQLHALKLPSGRTIKAMLSPQELQTALARGAQEL